MNLGQQLATRSINYCKYLRRKYRKLKNEPGMRERLDALNEVIKTKQHAYFQYFQKVPGFKWEGNRKQYARLK